MSEIVFVKFEIMFYNIIRLILEYFQKLLIGFRGFSGGLPSQIN